MELYGVAENREKKKWVDGSLIAIKLRKNSRFSLHLQALLSHGNPQCILIIVHRSKG
ncbi:hypothetical protein NC652_041750 [Populus alba x Populus x berolinensis]|nr:hypothetical protein NC652_041750 [Populus alba x Populus x berolinensis]